MVKQYYKVSDIARMYGVNRCKVQKWLNNGLKYIKIPGLTREFIIRISDLDLNAFEQQKQLKRIKSDAVLSQVYAVRGVVV